MKVNVLVVIGLCVHSLKLLNHQQVFIYFYLKEFLVLEHNELHNYLSECVF